MAGILGTAAVMFALGACLGAKRLTALLLGMIAGSLLAPQLAPPLATVLATTTGWNTWAGAAACWVAVYAVASLAVTTAITRLARRSITLHGRRLSRAGASFGAVAGAIVGWVAFGNFADVALESLPNDAPTSSQAVVRRPLEILRACRVFRSLSEAEANELANRGDVQAVFAAESFEKLLRTPGAMRKFSEAADGDWLAMAALAADPRLKAAMDEPEFLNRLRAVDVVALAADIESRRGEARAPRREPIELTVAVASLPPIVAEADFHRRIATEWFADSRSTANQRIARADDETLEADSPEADSPEDRAADAAAYWNAVGIAVEVFDRPTGPGAWLPRVVLPLLPDTAITTPSTAEQVRPSSHAEVE